MASLQPHNPAQQQQMQQQQQQQQQQQRHPLPALDPETSPIPGQQAWAILDLHGRLVRSSSAAAIAASGSALVRDAPTLYAMLVEATPLVPSGSGLRRMTVNLATVRYVIARDQHHVYLVQTKGV
mmetsp:Transcript_18424/g.51414  ORF Transcript_18424/g.51414 Transcript_18424/m.51414 type:complete len:125 (+) Transcript_18424:201-575(+)|eukprot:CAMPEP_0172366230 /NCGR_PEP_ID=MMETSP1060-20121228/14249_1 /TAXON_ID=37318 /ORGANISM="Pseudo-nitzschia pungens, Strain cf. cingulata" /LENGTH=124 /DNA_ID=CAMNT_0013089987 /DNA_START=93 /DNA_END=467 /DNA_ORIENTATION=-